MGELNGYGENPDNPHEGEDIDWSIPDKWLRSDDPDPARAEQTMDEFRAAHRSFSPDEADDLDREQDEKGRIDDATFSMDALTKSLDDFLTGPEAETIRVEVRGNDERSLVVRHYRDQVADDASRLLTDTDEFDPRTMAEVTLGLIELQSALIEPNVIPETIDDAELFVESDATLEDGDRAQISRDIAEKCKAVELFHGETGVTDDELARAYFVEWAKLGSTEAGTKLKSLLAQERKDAETTEDYKCLTTVCEMSERMGLSPAHWITKYADTDSAWSLRLDHYKRVREQLVDAQNAGMETTHKEEQLEAVDAKINGLIAQFALPPEDPDSLSTAAVSEHAMQALNVSRTFEEVALITARYLEVNSEREVTPDSLGQLVAFGTAALLEIDEDMAQDMDHQVSTLAEALEKVLEDPLMRDVLSYDQKLVAVEQGIWRVAYHAANDVPADDILADIRQQELTNASVRGDYLRSVAAGQYARSGDYTSVHAMIAELGASQKARAYVHYWGETETPEQMAALSPMGDAVAYESNKLLAARYEIAQALVSGDTTTMITKTLEAVEILQAHPETKDKPTLNPSLQWQQVEQLMDRVEQTGGGVALRRLCRAMLVQLQNGPPAPNLNYRKIYEPLEKSGVRADYEAVRASILAGPDEDSVKAVQLIESALRAGMILINE